MEADMLMARGDLNGFRPWSEQEVTDLMLCVEIGDSLQTAALFLLRDEDDVRQQAAALDVKLRDETQPRSGVGA
jgi:hypothetical protein